MSKQFNSTPAPTRSPWGVIQDRDELAPGIWQIGTPGHGGLKLSAERMKAMPKHLRQGGKYVPPSYGPGWFEEDCEWALVAIAFPESFKTSDLETARMIVDRYYPAIKAA